MKTLYNGKTKTVMLDEATGVVNLFFKDSATGENGVFDPGSNTVGGSVEGKGKIGLKISKHFFEIMEKNGIPTHYLGADVEQVRPLHPAMARRLAQADCGDLQPFELWTLRESWFKLTGAGDLRTIPFRRADGVLVPPEAGALCRVYDGIPGCMAAVCSFAERPPERLQFVPPREICT